MKRVLLTCYSEEMKKNGFGDDGLFVDRQWQMHNQEGFRADDVRTQVKCGVDIVRYGARG